MLNETFWILLSFICFVLLTFSSIKKSVLSALDSKIKSVEDSITDVVSAKNASSEKFDALQKEYEAAVINHNLAMQEAKVEAENILRATEEKVQILDQQALAVFNEYKQQSEGAMIDSLKGDILMTVLKLIEKDYQDNQPQQLKSIEDNINLIKKIWN